MLATVAIFSLGTEQGRIHCYQCVGNTFVCDEAERREWREKAQKESTKSKGRRKNTSENIPQTKGIEEKVAFGSAGNSVQFDQGTVKVNGKATL